MGANGVGDRRHCARVADEAQQDPVPRPCVEVLDLQGDGQALARRGSNRGQYI